MQENFLPCAFVTSDQTYAELAFSANFRKWKMASNSVKMKQIKITCILLNHQLVSNILLCKFIE